MNRNLVLVGRTGNGKSATANSNLGKNVFTSTLSAGAVTQLCQMESTELIDGHIINVIDTPGFFEFSSQSEFTGDEVINCVDKVNDGIHAFLLVFSVRTRFSQEEKAVIRNLRMLFGEKVRYMIVVFTGGDDLESSDMTLEQYMGTSCPPPLKKLVTQTGNECIVFNNRTKDEKQKKTQIQKLISTVNTAISRNKGRPFWDELIDLQAGVVKARLQAEKDANQASILEEKLKQLMAQVTTNLETEAVILRQKLLKAEAGLKISAQEILDMKDTLDATQKRLLELESSKTGCSIL